MVLKAERQRIKALLTEAITVLCKNGLGYKYTCAIEGLLGITLDDEDVFLVNINETIKGAERPPPEEETAKQDQEGAPESPATTASPSGTPRRRRRRSNNDQGDGSPAKRAAYGEDEKPGQNPDDVIVIKEEVSESDFSNQFYGDTGGGPEDNGQYQLQPDQYGAGCSQWDTSETQGGQPGWPAFSSHQQQQISQAASSAMMSPTQANVSTDAPSTQVHGYPNNSLAPGPRYQLSQTLVQPVLDKGWVVSSFRLAWSLKSPIPIGSIWKDVVTIRDELDGLVNQLPELVLAISAISGSHTNVKGTSQYSVLPSVRYWVVSRQPLCFRDAMAHLNKNRFQATASLQLQPFQQTLEPVVAALGRSVKDNLEGCVRHLVDASTRHCYGGASPLQAIMKLFVLDREAADMVDKTVLRLEAEKFYFEVVNMF